MKKFAAGLILLICAFTIFEVHRMIKEELLSRQRRKITTPFPCKDAKYFLEYNSRKCCTVKLLNLMAESEIKKCGKTYEKWSQEYMLFPYQDPETNELNFSLTSTIKSLGPAAIASGTIDDVALKTYVQKQTDDTDWDEKVGLAIDACKDLVAGFTPSTITYSDGKFTTTVTTIPLAYTQCILFTLIGECTESKEPTKNISPDCAKGTFAQTFCHLFSSSSTEDSKTIVKKSRKAKFSSNKKTQSVNSLN